MARTYPKLAKGTVVKIIGNLSGHGFNIGEMVKIGSDPGANSGLNTCYSCQAVTDGTTYSVYRKDMEVKDVPITKKDLDDAVKEKQKQIESIKADIALYKDKIAYLSEADVKEFDETEFTVWRSLKALDNKKLTQLEKTKLIAKLVKGQ